MQPERLRPLVPATSVAARRVRGMVKWFMPLKGSGFVVPDRGGPEMFVHTSVLLRSGMGDLLPGQRVFARAENVPRGLQATEIEPI